MYAVTVDVFQSYDQVVPAPQRCQPINVFHQVVIGKVQSSLFLSKTVHGHRRVGVFMYINPDDDRILMDVTSNTVHIFTSNQQYMLFLSPHATKWFWYLQHPFIVSHSGFTLRAPEGQHSIQPLPTNPSFT